MGERQRVATTLGEDGHPGRLERLDGKLDLDVAELADIVVASEPALGPAEENIASRLHEPVAVHDTLSVVREDAFPGIGLQDRGSRLLDLQEERIFSPAIIKTIAQLVPTLPTPTTLIAASISS